MPANRLLSETSPYLKQHGHDPVDWFGWGDEAFSLARSFGKPIFLSIGYASCHWCHVMHRESFSDPAVAEMLNRWFVSVKVDREARPDIDELYMAYVVASTGHGGWPMSVFLTPELVPIFGGTYFPPSAGLGVPSFPSVLDRVHEALESHPDQVADTAADSLSYLATMFRPLPGEAPSRPAVDRAARIVLASADPRFGGFGGAPKFPQAPVTDFLLAYYADTGDERALHAVEAAVEGMVRGGIYDQVGGGLSRYSVDGQWLVPHFEKMLYDSAQLLSTLAALHRAAPRVEWLEAARQTASFLERDLRLNSGTYASSLDADTDSVEGATYVWDYDELASLLEPAELALAREELCVTPGGNWEGTNIVTRRMGRTDRAEKVDDLLAHLLEIRGVRRQPARDDKAIVAWNALAARGLLAAGDAFDEAALSARGVELVRTLIARGVAEDAGTRRLMDDPASESIRTLEDAAGLALAALDAGQQSDDTGLMDAASDVLARARGLFYDGDGTWYLTPEGVDLPARPREQHDGATPSGASMATLAAVRLASRDPDWRPIAEASLARMMPLIERSPFSAGTALVALVEFLAGAERV